MAAWPRWRQGCGRRARAWCCGGAIRRRSSPALAEAAGADAVHAGYAHEPGWRQADAAVAAALQAAGRRLVLHRTATLIDPDAVRSQTGSVYGMYTPFARAVEALGEPPEPLAAPARIHAARPVASDRLEDWGLLPAHPDWAGGLRALWRPGEAAAQARLVAFVGGAVGRYATGRNLPGEDGTSMLSPHLHFGELSPRSVWHASRTTDDGKDHHTYRRELIWRDFAAYLLWHKPTAARRAASAPANCEALPFREDPTRLLCAPGRAGQTGVPIVDAGMRQLWQTRLDA